MTRKTWTVMWSVMLIGIFLTTAAGGLFGKDDPAKVTERFWNAAASGGAKAARPYMTKASQVAIDKGTLTLTAGKGPGSIITGETKIQGNKATVISEFSEQPGKQHTTFLVKEDGKWKIDLMPTIMGMLSEEDRKRMAKFQGKTFDELLADPEIGKQLEETREKLRSGMAAGMAAAMEANMAALGANGNAQAIAAKMAAAMAEAMGGAKPEEEVFLLPDMGWGDPFLNPRDRIKPTITPDDIIPELGDEKKKVWEDALTELVVECIIGIENELAAIVSGVRVRPGNIIKGGKLRFEVKKITRNAVHLHCISEEEEFRKFSGITVRRKIPL